MNGKRVIFLVDMNAFFINCETLRHPELRGKPAAVAGDPERRSGIILTASYEARAFGVKTTMTLGEAKRICPRLILLPCAHHYYSKISGRVMDILGRYTPALEQASVDEAWLDMTGCEILSGSPYDAAKNIMNDIDKELGLPCSIGISNNKFLSKMASDMKKPRGITELWEHETSEKLWPLPVGAMYGVGARTAARLRDIGIFKIGDIPLCGRDTMTKRFGKYGTHLYELACGNDNSPVEPRDSEGMKSIGRSTTLPQDITDIEEAKKIILSLAEEIGADARRHNKRGTTAQITVKYDDFTVFTRQISVKPSFLTKDISAAGIELLNKNWTGRPIRLLGLSVTGFTEEQMHQLSFFDTEEDSSPQKEEDIERAVDDIRRRYGNETIKRASLLNKEPRRH